MLLFGNSNDNMRQIPVLSDLANYLTVPSLPPSSLAISETHLAMITLRRRGGAFKPLNLGVLRLPDGLVRGSFEELNITDESAMLDHLEKTATQAGMGKIKTLSASLPASTGRSMVIALDTQPSTSNELAQLIEWKIERNIGRKIADLRFSYSKLPDAQSGHHWLASVAVERVIAQYEEIFSQLDWKVGLIAPRHLGEVQWLMRLGSEEDQIVVSLQDNGFTAIIIRGQTPLLIREVECSIDEREDELYRLIVFYRDRLISPGIPNQLHTVLVIGNPADQRRIKDLIASALESNVTSLDPLQLGLIIDSQAPFNHFAAAGGLATMAWN